MFPEVASGVEPLYEVLQTSASPLGHATDQFNYPLIKFL